MARRLCSSVFLSLWLTGVYLGSTGFTQGSDMALEVLPSQIKINMLYKGARVKVNGRVRECDSVALKLQGEDVEVVLNRKGKVGFIWMNVAKLLVKNVPQIYLLATSTGFENVCSAERIEQLNLGYSALKNRLTFTSKKPLQGWEFDEFIKMKEDCGSYKISSDIVLVPSDNGYSTFSYVFDIPDTLPDGEYPLVLYCFNKGILVGQTTKTLSVEKTGLPLLTSNMAGAHPALYGVLANFIAFAAGITIGMIFSRTNANE